MISRQGVLRARDGHRDDAGGSPWRDDDFVMPANPGVGRYGDEVWVFPPDRDSGRPSRIDFGDAGMFPNDEWRGLARDLGMALVGRRPGREQLSRSRQKPVTVAQSLRRLGLLGRWATAVGHGLPTEWASTTVDAFVVAYHASRLPNRVADDNPKSTAATRHTLAAYLNLIALLHEHRNQLCHGMGHRPWATWPSVGAYEIAGVVPDLEGQTAIIEPDAWWAAVRAALRVLNEWAPHIVTSWTAFHDAQRARRGSWGPAARATLEAWADRPDSLLPVDRDGRPSWSTVAAWCGIGDIRSDRPALAALGERLIAEGRTTRCWWPRPQGPGHDPSPPWLGRMEFEDLFSYAGLVRNAALVVLAALSAMRDSELQELRVGCVEFHDGSWALRSTIQKHQRQPQPGVWWVTPVAVEAIGVLEDLVRPIDVFVIHPVSGERVPSNHLICTLGRGDHSRAGLAPGSRPFERFTAWIDEHAEEFGFDPIGANISAHQFRRTFAVIAAWQPDGHVAVELQLKDTADVAAGYYANHDRKWFEAYELAKAEAVGGRIRSYAADGVARELAGPAGDSFAAKVLAAINAANSAGLGPVAAIDAQEQAAMTVAGLHACGDGWDCAGDRRHARCLAVQAAKDDEPFASGRPQLTSGLCFELGGGPDRACRNVILDAPAHLAFWDIEAARIEQHIGAASDDRPLLRCRLQLELDGARASIAEMEQACRRQPSRLLRRFEEERLRLLERLTDDRHAPGTAAIYRPLILAQEQRITWLASLAAAATESS